MWFTQIDGVKEYVDENASSNNQRNMMSPGGPGMPGMDPGMMGPDMMDPGMMEGPPPVPNEVAWLRLKGHSLVMDANDPKSVEDYFRENLKKSPLFDLEDPANYKNPVLTLNSENDNVTSFVIYVKLKKSIKQ